MQDSRSMMSPRRRVLYLSVVLLTMLATLKQFSDSTAYSISMWVMEFLVLALIAYEVGSVIFHRRKVRTQLAGIFNLISKGHTIQRSALREVAGEERINEWITSVNEWDEETATFLKRFSSQAVATFQQGVWRDASYAGVAFNAQRSLGLLLLRLDNLQGIMEKPEVYF
jgi:hypothetical protein